MKKIFAFLSITLFVIAVACSKKNQSIKNPSPVNGKWIFSDMDNDEPYYIWRYGDINPDTIILKEKEYVFLDKHNDTLESGTYTTGHGKSINGTGMIQEYDSILFNMEKNSSLLDVALPPLYSLFYKMNNGKLSFSNSYKNSAVPQGYVSYSLSN